MKTYHYQREIQINWDMGYRTGRRDALLGIRLAVTLNDNPSLPGYVDGYRAGHADVKQENNQ